ncbi:methyltransferase domain-containing protein [bacterium]|nr:methyltransferase domain-containing protein [bacterium]
MNETTDQQSLLHAVSEYYGSTLESASDLKTSACCSVEAVPPHVRPILAKIQSEVHEKSYGCGSPIPLGLEGAHVLDLGCGTGRDCLVMAALVGEQGRVLGVDMTPEQLEVAERWLPFHEKSLGIRPGVLSFRQGEMEKLEALDLKESSFDLVISNCVLNLSPDKEKLFREIFRVLKPGGELYFSDVFADRRIPRELQEDPVLRGECLSGALYTEDFRRMLRDIGCRDYRTVSTTPVTLEDGAIHEKIGMVQFFSETIRAFHISDLEDGPEDYGQVAIYRTPMLGAAHHFKLDDRISFERDRPVRVSGNTAAILEQSRFAPYFEIIGDRSRHFGMFSSEEGHEELSLPHEHDSCC